MQNKKLLINENEKKNCEMLYFKNSMQFKVILNRRIVLVKSSILLIKFHPTICHSDCYLYINIAY